MANQAFDFESFASRYNSAISGLQDAIAGVKAIIPAVQDVAEQTGSAKLTKTTESFITVAEQQIACFGSVEESAEAVQNAYKKINDATN